MPPKRTSAAATAKPASRAAKPASSRATKPVSTKASKPAVTNSVPSKEDDIAEDGDAAAPNGHVVEEEKPKPSGTVNGKTRRASASPDKAPAAKKGRVGDLAQDAKKTSRRRSSIGGIPINAIPGVPPVASPHNALFIWGTGDMGQFGLGPDELDEIARPKLHSWFEEQIEDGKLSRDGKEGSGGLEAVACGGMHTLAIDEAGRVRSWGINDNAALGRKTSDVPDPNNPGSMIPNEDLETVPMVIESLEKEKFRAVQVSAGDSISVAISDSGELRAWGSFRSNDGVLGFDGVPGHPKFQYNPISLPAFSKVQIVSVSCGADHVLALTTTGRVYVWGKGEENQLGRRIIERRRINGLEPERLGLKNIVHVSAGIYHSFAVDTEGNVFAWGLNTFHQTGLSSKHGGDQTMIITPTKVEGLSPEQHGGSKVVQVSGGEHYSLFLFDNGEVWGCGRCDAHELGIAEDHPAMEGIKERREEVTEEREAKVATRQKKLDAILQADKVDEDAKEKAELELAEARAALGVPMDEYVPEPIRICFPPIPEQYEIVPPFPAYNDSKPSDNPIANISAGTRHNIAVSRSGHVYSWGLGNQGQLGLGSEESVDVPTLVRSKLLRPYSANYASAGGQHCVLLATKNE
ncbi:hypothetical protein IAR55_003317 [Kwoniella newhampshirensis]|uniref:RCC1-like domain-containing protein n=1 Tax=Kwoniella newhampshirensis TaxID=1651941 RepID=A0AAW0YWR3_9TREE